MPVNAAAAPLSDSTERLSSLTQAEQLRLYQANLRTALPLNLGVALVVTAVLWGEAGPVPLGWWWLAMGLALLLRCWETFGAWVGEPAGPQEALRRTRAGSWALALAWGLAGLIVPTQDVLVLVFVVIVLVGLTAGTTVLSGFDPHNCIGFAILSFAPLMLSLALDGDPRLRTLALLMGLHVAVTSLMSLRAWAGFKAAMTARSLEAERLAALARSEERLRQLSGELQRERDLLQLTLQSIDQGLSLLGPDGRVQVFNQRVSALSNLPEHLLASGPTGLELLAYQVSHGLLGPDMSLVTPVLRDRLQRVLLGELPWPQSERHVRRNLEGQVVEVKTRRLANGYVVRTYTDVTAFVEAQERLLASEAEARKLALVAAHTDNGVAILDAQRGIEWINASFERVCGWSFAEVRGRRPRDFLIGPRTDPATVRALDDQLATRDWAEGELEITNREGRTHWVAVEQRVIRGDDGAVTQYILIGRSVQARREADAALRAARDEAVQASRAKTGFLSAMSHELRTPLNAILGFAQLLEVDAEVTLDARQRRYLREIRAAGDHLLDLISDVLDLARVESGAMPLTAEPVALRQVADECLSLLRPLAEAHQVALPDPAGLDDLAVQADRRRVKQVLLNLLTNAVKYNRPGGRVDLQASRQGHEVRMAVLDTGAGIAPEDQARLFNAFERLDADRRGVEGVGVGLALSRQLVERMGGVIGVLSRPAEGSTFWFTLPQAAVAPAAGPLPAAVPMLPPGPHQGRWHLLYIEDNPVNAVLMEAMLSRDPAARLQIALLPGEGLTLAWQAPPDLVLLDIQLPGMDGYEVLQRLRADERTKRMPVIAISANAAPGDIQRGLAAGFDDYLAKPLDLNLLVHTLTRVLTARRAS